MQCRIVWRSKLNGAEKRGAPMGKKAAEYFLKMAKQSSGRFVDIWIEEE